MERLPSGTNVVYPSAILSGLTDSNLKQSGTTLGLRAFRGVSRWGVNRFRREISWLVQRYPEMGADPDVLAELRTIATLGEASDTAVSSTSPRAKTHVQELLQGRSGSLGERGVAWEALAAILWVNEAALEPITTLLELRLEGEELSSVRMCMFHAANAVLKHNTSRGLALVRRLAEQDIAAVHSSAGQHVLRWAAYNHATEIRPILNRLGASDDEALRALSLALEAGLALRDESLEPGFSAPFADDVLRRRVAAFVAVGNLSSDTVGQRAACWLRLFFDDTQPAVRQEAAQVDWSDVLDVDDSTDFARAFLRSPTFADEPDHLMRALETRVDRFPELTFDTVIRVLALQDIWAADADQRYSWATHNLGRVLVALYRAFEGNNVREEQLLDLFDNYLAADLRDLGEEIRAYERH